MPGLAPCHILHHLPSPAFPSFLFVLLVTKSLSIYCAKEDRTSDLYQIIELSEKAHPKRGRANKKGVWQCHPNYGMRAIGWILDCGFWAMEGGYSFIRSLDYMKRAVPRCDISHLKTTFWKRRNSP